MKVNWTDYAEASYLELLEYLSMHNSKKEIKALTTGIRRAINNILENPEMYPKLGKQLPDVHKAVVTKRASLFYKIKADEIEISAVFDTRQAPGKLKIS